MARNYLSLFFRFLFTYLFPIKFLHHFISFSFIYRIRVHIYIQSYCNNNMHIPALQYRGSQFRSTRTCDWYIQNCIVVYVLIFSKQKSNGYSGFLYSSVNGRFRVKTTEVRRVHVHSSLLVARHPIRTPLTRKKIV